MARNRTASLGRAAWLAALGLAAALSPARGQAPAPEGQAAAGNVGQFFTVVEPINGETIERIVTSAKPAIERAAAQGVHPVLVFEFRPGDAAPGQTSFGSAAELMEFISRELSGAKLTVAYVPEPIKGYAVLPVLACDEIVMGTGAALGPITPEGEAVRVRDRETVRDLAVRKGRDADLLLGLLDPDSDLRVVRTADRQTHYVLAERLEEFRKAHAVDSVAPAWEGGRRGTLTAEQARGNLARLLADDRAKVAEVYRLPTTSDDPTLGGPIRPVLIRIEGAIDQVKESYLRRRIAQAVADGDNLIIFDLDSEGGLDRQADRIADAIARLKDVRTVAFVDERAMGVSALIALACDEIVFGRKGRMGDVGQVLDGGSATPLDERMADVLADRAEALAKQNGYPTAVARAMVDPSAVVFAARDAHTGTVAFVTQEEIDADPGRYQKQETIKEAGSLLTVGADEAPALGLATKVVRDLDELKVALNLGSKNLRLDAPTWVDSLVTLLNTPWMSWLLLFVGMFMLILELKLPGVGLPAIISALAFLLFFWGHYLGGTADQLEILLFLVGLVCLALELFVFPGFGVFGMSGILLILVSVVMASHTFVWPTEEYEFRQMGRTILQLSVAIVGVAIGAVILGRYFPSLPLFNRMVLKPEPIGEPDDPTAKPPPDTEAPLFYLLGEVGTTTTVLKPSGKARFGELLVDVTADGFYIEAGQPVEVVEVRGSRVIVKKA